MEDQGKETGTERLSRLREEARTLGIVGTMTADEFEAAIKAKKDPLDTPKDDGLTHAEASKIDARMKYEEEAREKFKRDRQKKIERASIVAESEGLGIEIDLPENPTEVQLARARNKLGLEKSAPKPSPETLAIESSQRGYYIFTNREQEDASHTVNPGGKYTIRLIPDQIHVLSKEHIRLFRKMAVVPIYSRVTVPGPIVEGQIKEECRRTGSKPRFAFDHLGDAPKDAPFGLVTNIKILEELKQLS